MSLFDQAVSSSIDKIDGGLGLSELAGANFQNELSSILGDSRGLNIINSMRGAAESLPKGFPGIDRVFEQANLKGVESLIPADSTLSGTAFPDFESLEKTLPDLSTFTNLDLKSFSGLPASIENIFGADPFNSGLLGSKQGFASIFEGLPKVFEGAGSSVANPFAPVESIFGQGKDPFASLNNGVDGFNPLSDLKSLFAGESSPLGGLLGSITGGEGGIGGMLGSLLQGGMGAISGLLSQIGPLLQEIIPLITKLAPLALAIL